VGVARVTGENLQSLSDVELAEAYVENVLARTATEHVGRINRLLRQLRKAARLAGRRAMG
jgi:hypothetical protein